MSRPDRIRPYEKNRWYWQFDGKPLLLLGGSDEDNLFNHPDLPPHGLEAHLDLLVSVGGNYVRNTMSSRDPGNVWPFHRDPTTGKYDLERMGDEYWRRFERFMQMTADREIIVQIELWDRFDFAREPWNANPFNPGNNVNYTVEESGLPIEITSHPGRRENPFFRTVPELEDNALVRHYQERFVDQLLSISLAYPHVLYCISNETNESPHWGAYWADMIRRRAAEAGVGVEVTEMWDAWDLAGDEHRNTFDHPERYSFVDISQNNHQRGQTHWENIQAARERLALLPRPMNSVKIYGGHPHGGGVEEGTHKMWRNIMGGLASTRFHRPSSGIGLGELARVHLRSARMFADAMDVFAAQPANHLLRERRENAAYCMAIPGEAYAVYFPVAGSVTLALDFPAARSVTSAEDASAAGFLTPGLDDASASRFDASRTTGTFTLQWLEILANRWHEPETVELRPGGSHPVPSQPVDRNPVDPRPGVPHPTEQPASNSHVCLSLVTPGQGQWVALVKSNPRTDA